MTFMLACFCVDISGVAWSPDGRLLASCALDSSICIWRVRTQHPQQQQQQIDFVLARRIEGQVATDVKKGQKQGANVTAPRGHSGFVKGIAWAWAGDGLGMFLASQSDDQSLIVWHVCVQEGGAFRAETSITVDLHFCLSEPFADSPTSTFFRRPSWSPPVCVQGENQVITCHSVLAAANACNAGAPVALLVDPHCRENSPSHQSLVGHVTPIEVTCFCPWLFRQMASETCPISVLAIASQDGSVSIWTSVGRNEAESGRPVVVLDGLFEHAVLGLAWSGPEVLHAVSFDGFVTSFRIPLEQLLQATAFIPPRPLSTSKSPVASSTKTASPPSDASPAAMLSSVRQLENHKSLLSTSSTTVNGKRRIAPQLLLTTSVTATAALVQESAASVPVVEKKWNLPFIRIESPSLTQTRLTRKFPCPRVIKMPGVSLEINRDTITAIESTCYLWKLVLTGERSCGPVCLFGQVLFLGIRGGELWQVSVRSGRCLSVPMLFSGEILALQQDDNALLVITSDALIHRITSKVELAVQSWTIPVPPEVAEVESFSAERVLNFGAHSPIKFNGFGVWHPVLASFPESSFLPRTAYSELSRIISSGSASSTLLLGDDVEGFGGLSDELVSLELLLAEAQESERRQFYEELVQAYATRCLLSGDARLLARLAELYRSQLDCAGTAASLIKSLAQRLLPEFLEDLE